MMNSTRYNDDNDSASTTTVSVTLWGTKIRGRYSYHANVNSTFMPKANDNNNDNNNNDNNDNSILYEASPTNISTSSSPNKCMKKSSMDSPKTIVIENIEIKNDDGSISLHPTMGDIVVKANNIPFNSIEAIEKYYVNDDNEKFKIEVPFIAQVSASSSPSLGETTVQSIESIDMMMSPTQHQHPSSSLSSQPVPAPTPTPTVPKQSNSVVIDSATFWETIESQNHFALYNKRLFDASLESLNCGGDYNMLKKTQDRILDDDDDDILGPILQPNIAPFSALQQMSNSDKMSFFYKRLVSCVLVPKSKRNESREYNKTPKLVDAISLSESFGNPENIIRTWPVMGQLTALGNNIDNETMNKIIRKRTQNELLKVGVIRGPDNNMTASETRRYEDDAEKNKEDDEISTLLRSAVQDLRKIETDINTKLLKLKKEIDTDAVKSEAKVSKMKRDKEKYLMIKYEKMKKKK